MEKTKNIKKVIAVGGFFDVLTNREYKPGDEVIGWDEARATHYAGINMVRLEIAPGEQPELIVVQKPAAAKPKTSRKPGPSVKK